MDFGSVDQLDFLVKEKRPTDLELMIDLVISIAELNL